MPECVHRLATIVARHASILDRTGVPVMGAVRWCPECGAISAEASDCTPLGRWHHVGDSSVLEQAKAAVRDEKQAHKLVAAREALGMEPEHV
jgi:hypothetical protein